MMKKIIILIITLIVIALGVFGFIELNKKYNFFVSKKDRLVATSDYGDVYKSDIQAYLDNVEKIFSKKIVLEKLSKDEKKIIINKIVNQKKILNDAKKANIENSEEFKTKFENVKNDLMKEIYLRSLIDKNITEDVVKNRYKQLKAELEGKLEFKVKHILVKEEKDIKKVQNELKTNKFEDVAKKYSIDTTAQNGGSLGYIIEGQTVKEFEDELKKAELNKISEPFKTQFGWHILVKEEQKNVKIPEFNEVKDNLKNELVGNFIKNYGENNIKKANIVLY